MKYPKNRFNGYNPCSDKEWLKKKFVDEGLSRKEIAEKIGCSYNSVNTWIWKHGLRKKKSYTPERLEQLHLEERKSIQEIAEMFGVSDDTIIYQLAQNEIEYIPNINRKDRLAKYTKQWVTENYLEQDISISQLALREGLNRKTLTSIIKSYGIDIKYFENTVPVQLDNLLRCWTYNNLRKDILLSHSECECCKKDGTKNSLQLHHIVPIKVIVLESIIESGIDPDTEEHIYELYQWILDNHDLFKDPKNIKVLCSECHSNEHARQSEAKLSKEFIERRFNDYRKHTDSLAQ